jgi:hypothetical protein
VISPYPHLAPELQALRGESLRLWGDATQRLSALEAIVVAWETSAADLELAVARVDRAVVDGLQALSLPRGPIREVRIESRGRGWLGHKDADCSLVLDAERMSAVIRDLQRPDTVFRTWVHESLHARQPFAPSVGQEQRRFRGFEEGMVEGLARLVTLENARMTPLASSYDYYVGAYRSLADVLAINLEQFWRALWRSPTGEVQTAFMSVLDALQRERSGRDLIEPQRSRVQALAQQVFRSERSADSRADDLTLTRLWRTALR